MKIVPTTTQNLVKDGDTGIHYEHLEIRGRAKLTLPRHHGLGDRQAPTSGPTKEIRKSYPTDELTGKLETNATFVNAAALYSNEITKNPRMQHSTKEIRLRPITTLRRTWPELFQIEVRRVTPVSIKNYIAEFERGKWPYLPNGAKADSVPVTSLVPARSKERLAGERSAYGTTSTWRRMKRLG